MNLEISKFLKNFIQASRQFSPSSHSYASDFIDADIIKNALLRRYFQHRYRERSETVVINFNPRDIDQTRGGIKAGAQVPAARIKERYELVALKTRKFQWSCWNRHAPSPISNMPRENVYVLDTIIPARTLPFPRVSSYVRSKTSAEKKEKTMRRRTWHHDLPGGTRTTWTDRRTNRRSPKKLSPLYQMEVYRDTGDFSRYQAIRQVSQVETRERTREREKRTVLSFSSSRMHGGSARSHSLALVLFMIFSCVPAAEARTLASTWGEWEVSVNDFAGLGPNGRVYVTVAIEEVVSLPMRKMCYIVDDS